MVLCWKIFSLSKFWGVSVLWKKSIFSIFSLPHLKKIQTILIRPILNFDALPIAHFETYVPLFLKHLWKLAISLKLWVPAHFEVGWSRTVAAKIGVFRPLFWRKSFFWPISTQWTPPSVIHGWKATDLHLMMVKIFDFRGRSRTDFLHDLRLRHIYVFVQITSAYLSRLPQHICSDYLDIRTEDSVVRNQLCGQWDLRCEFCRNLANIKSSYFDSFTSGEMRG